MSGVRNYPHSSCTKPSRTILDHRLIEAVDKHGSMISDEERRREVEFLYGNSRESAWYERLESSKLARAYRQITNGTVVASRWMNWKRTGKAKWDLDGGFGDSRMGYSEGSN